MKNIFSEPRTQEILTIPLLEQAFHKGTGDFHADIETLYFIDKLINCLKFNGFIKDKSTLIKAEDELKKYSEKQLSSKAEDKSRASHYTTSVSVELTQVNLQYENIQLFFSEITRHELEEIKDFIFRLQNNDESLQLPTRFQTNLRYGSQL